MSRRWLVPSLALVVGAVPLVAVAGQADASVLPANCTGTTQITCVFDYNGTDGSDGSAQTWTVPAGVTSAHFEVYGAQGGQDLQSGFGGLGGSTSAAVQLQPGSTVAVTVGGQGAFLLGGFNGGGSSGAAFGGGGASDVRIGGASLSDRVLVAGGGGGGAGFCGFSECPVGGTGGGTTGGQGTATSSTTPTFGSGGTQAAGGAGSTGGGGTGGAAGLGGSGYGFGGGGGGGYFGGGGGGEIDSGTVNEDIAGTGAGGGGSGYYSPDTNLVSGGATTAGVRSGNGQVVITYAALYNFSGFFSPVDNLPVVNTVKAGQAVPVKFSLGGNQGVDVFASGYPQVQQYACASGAPVDAIEQTATAGNSSLSYDATTGIYTYVWKTDKAWVGTCRTLDLRLVDGTDHKANFKLLK